MQNGGGGSHAVDGMTRRTTVALLVLTVGFVVLVLPISSVYVVAAVRGFAVSPATDPTFIVCREMAQVLEQINYSVNFFSYLLFNRLFREQLIGLFAAPSKDHKP